MGDGFEQVDQVLAVALDTDRNVAALGIELYFLVVVIDEVVVDDDHPQPDTKGLTTVSGDE